jgi:hypothetical protein
MPLYLVAASKDTYTFTACKKFLMNGGTDCPPEIQPIKIDPAVQINILGRPQLASVRTCALLIMHTTVVRPSLCLLALPCPHIISAAYTSFLIIVGDNELHTFICTYILESCIVLTCFTLPAYNISCIHNNLSYTSIHALDR